MNRRSPLPCISGCIGINRGHDISRYFTIFPIFTATYVRGGGPPQSPNQLQNSPSQLQTPPNSSTPAPISSKQLHPTLNTSNGNSLNQLQHSHKQLHPAPFHIAPKKVSTSCNPAQSSPNLTQNSSTKPQPSSIKSSNNPAPK